VTGVGAAFPFVTAREPVTTTSLIDASVDCAQLAAGTATMQAPANKANFQGFKFISSPAKRSTRPGSTNSYFALYRNFCQVAAKRCDPQAGKA
jgi:hypothetical protein